MFCSNCGKATFAIVLSKACIAVAIIKATAACRRLVIAIIVASTVIDFSRGNRLWTRGRGSTARRLYHLVGNSGGRSFGAPSAPLMAS
jgi:hypothetical protein